MLTPQPKPEPSLSAVGLGHWFDPGRWLFRGQDFELQPGRLTVVTGPSGSGKSTLLSLLAGWERPREGHIVKANVERTAWVFQNPIGVAGRTALDHVALPLVARGCGRREAEAQADEILDRFGLGEVRASRFAELSGGEAQRLMLARGLASAPDLLLIDEPTAQLDRPTAAVVSSHLGAVASDGVLVVIATHDPDITVQAGALVELGSP